MKRMVTVELEQSTQAAGEPYASDAGVWIKVVEVAVASVELHSRKNVGVQHLDDLCFHITISREALLTRRWRRLQTRRRKRHSTVDAAAAVAADAVADAAVEAVAAAAVASAAA
eukprot:CAMPEP_0119303674 /NCGR_PEP_ID=MMETSP1333-20130426/5059_1 /TAXON_ID=418940 /ORGANISM="Scyphosphaera apsteinii, Strain RCC1455" /LENGTH=113 /DNA_ID=CAMNT_0007306413 /DNA_START=289 /DNA_END=629 /DNA_ORIENTATION=-